MPMSSSLWLGGEKCIVRSDFLNLLLKPSIH